MVDISFADIRRPDGRDIERYIGTQRELSESRVKELKQYVTTVDACFPTGVILAISSSDAEFDKKRGLLRIRKSDEVAKIIDGQHRIAGLKEYSGPPFELNVTIFIDMDLEDQSMVFATINLKQTKVSKSLAYDLYEHAKGRSPQKTSHDIAKLLNFKSGSPLHRRIKILGKSDGTGGFITQAAFVDRLMNMMSADPMADKDQLKRRRSIPPLNNQGNKLIFRSWFMNGEDALIARTLWNYFSAVAERWNDAWESTDRGMILHRTTGFAALMRVLPSIWSRLDVVSKPPSTAAFLQHLRRVELENEDFSSDRFKPGSSGEGDLVKALLAGIAP